METEERLLEQDSYLELRNNKQAYTGFCDDILSNVVGRMAWDNQKHSQLVSEIASPTDEAWVLLLLENSWEVWMQMAKHSNYKIPENEERKQPKYTKGTTSTGRNEGWSKQAILQFNELCALVIQDRKENTTFDQEYLKNKKEEHEKQDSRKRKRAADMMADDTEVITAVIDMEGIEHRLRKTNSSTRNTSCSEEADMVETTTQR